MSIFMKVTKKNWITNINSFYFDARLKLLFVFEWKEKVCYRRRFCFYSSCIHCNCVCFFWLLYIYSAVKNYRLTYSNRFVYSFSTMLDFRGKQGLQKGIHSSALYLTRILNLSTMPLNFRKKIFFWNRSIFPCEKL